MIIPERVEGGVLLPLDLLHKRAREAGVLRLPSQVFIPDEVIADLQPGPGPDDVERLTGFDPAVEAGEVDKEASRLALAAELEESGMGKQAAYQAAGEAIAASSSLAAPATLKPVPKRRSLSDALREIKMDVKHLGRPALAPPSQESIYDKVRNQVSATIDREALEKELDGIVLDSDQQKALDFLLGMTSGVAALTGEAGTGKSLVIKKLMLARNVAVCAPTGIAAMNIGGPTLDSLFSYDRTTNSTRSERRLKLIMSVIPDIIVIDEASMIGSKMAAYILGVARRFGKVIILVGDWAQASPVKDGWGTESELVMGAHVIKLHKVHRQSDTRMLGALNAIRRGEVTPLAKEVFQSCIVHEPPQDDQFIRLFATNDTADAFNQQRLMAVPKQTRLWRLFAEYYDDREVQTYEITPEEQNRAIKASRMAHASQFRVGARVMIRMNDPSDEREFVNGDLGTIVSAEMGDGSPIDDQPPFNPFMNAGQLEPTPKSLVIELDRNGSAVRIGRMSQEVKDAMGKAKFTICGIPISLGWAITIHKSQGITVDKAFLDMQTITYMQGESKHGLAYVAMSRTRTLEGLRIQNWRDEAVYCSPHVRHMI